MINPISKVGDVELYEIKGSAKEPYKIKRIGDVWSCSCPSWRNQSQDISRRTCKHIRKIRGDEAESIRIGGSLTIKAAPTKNKVTQVPPALLLAEKWTPEVDPTGWWMSEKLDGMRCFWNGKELISRLGNKIWAPEWFTKDLPKDIQLDGELFLGRKMFQETISIVRRQDMPDTWNKITYLVFDIPSSKEVFEERYDQLWDIKRRNQLPEHAIVVNQIRCKSIKDLKDRLADIEKIGGEGIMLRQPESLYEGSRSSTLLKVKSFIDAEAKILSYEDGKKGGNREGMVGAFWVEAVNGELKGKKFKVGTGQSHELLKNPPPIGSLITFRYVKSALSDDGLPRPAAYVGPAIDK